MTHEQETRGGTSASNAEADSLCPGRHIAQRGLPPEPESEDAASGTRIHAALAGELTLDKLTGDEGDMYADCMTQLACLCDSFDFVGDVKIIRERRLWYLDHSGKADFIAIAGDRALIVDYKTGRSEVADSARNMQLRDLVALVWMHQLNLDQITVAVIQPHVSRTPDVCEYGVEEITAAFSAMDRRVIASNNPASPRIPGEVQCKYCRAKGVCREFMAASQVPAAPSLETGIAKLDSGRLGEFLSICRLAEGVAETELRKRLEAGETGTGWELAPGHERTKITDVQGVWSSAISHGVTADEFMRSVNVSVTGLKDAIKASLGLKGRALDEAFNTITAGHTETTTGEKRLQKESKSHETHSMDNLERESTDGRRQTKVRLYR